MTNTEIDDADIFSESRSLASLPDDLRQRFVEAEARRQSRIRWSKFFVGVVVAAALIYGVRMIVWAWRLAGF